MFSQDWDIKPRGIKCCGCDKAFVDLQHYVSRLCFDKAGYSRSDFCLECWPKRGDDASTVSVWHGLFKAPEPPPAEAVKKETAESLLRRMIADGETSSINVIFVLAVMLERRRLLIERDVKIRPDGTRLRIYEHRGTGETFVITDPMLHMDRLEDVQREVLGMLGPEGDNA